MADMVTKEHRPVASPDLDVIEKKDAYVVMADFPGAGSESIDVNLNGDVMTVTASTAPAEVDGLPLLHQEYGLRDYETTLKISHAVDREQVEAELKDGVLVLTLPKAPEVKPRQIKIKTAA